MMLAQKTSVLSIEILIPDKTDKEKYGLPVQRKITYYYIVCQLLPLEDASSIPQYLKIHLLTLKKIFIIIACFIWFCVNVANGLETEKGNTLIT